MSRVFFADNGFQREFSRTQAKGYKKFTVDSEINTVQQVKLTSVEDELRLVPDVDAKESDQDTYVFLCKEFGLANVGNIKSVVSVIFLDKEHMLVTLHNGRICVNYNGSPIEPCIGEDTSKYKINNIKWVNADDIRAYAGRQGETGLFLNDLEVYYELSGSITDSNLSSFSIKPLHDQCKDLSCGHIEAYRLAKQNAEAEKKAQEAQEKLMNMVSQPTINNNDWEDEDEDWDDEDDDWDDDDEY